MYNKGMNLVLFDFDGRGTKETMEDIIKNKTYSMGHAFVLKFMLEGMI